MKTKIIPFDLETAMKIQAGEIEGRIVQANGLPADILAYDINGSNLAVRFTREDGSEGVDEYQPNGKVQAEWCKSDEDFALVLEVSCTHIEPQFKPFDKVLVRANNEMCWKPTFYVSTEITEDNKTFYETIGGVYHEQCILYEGNEKLVGTTDKPKED